MAFIAVEPGVVLMYFFMFVEVSLLGKLLMAISVRAFKRFFSGVDSQVVKEVMALFENLFTSLILALENSKFPSRIRVPIVIYSKFLS